ncbi:MAG: hypothetical protein AB7P21_01685 [Lautropia sp.]
MRTSTTAILARNAHWSGRVATEPYEAGWASEALVFVRALKTPTLTHGDAFVEISPDGMHWIREGSRFALPRRKDEVGFVRIRHFGNWLRVAAELPQGAAIVVLVTLHLKS